MLRGKRVRSVYRDFRVFIPRFPRSLFLFAVCSLALQVRAQDAASIHVVAVRGECVRDVPVAIINGRLTVLRFDPPPGFVLPSAVNQNVLTRFVIDAPARDLIVAEMRKNRGVRVVDRIEDANAVFFVCSSYLNDLTSMRMQINKTTVNESYRVGVQATLLPAADFTLRADAYRRLRQSAPWKMDTAEDPDLKTARDRANPGGMAQVGGMVMVTSNREWGDPISPAVTVKQFFREAKDLLPRAAAWARPAVPEAREVRRPALVAGREGETPAPADAGAKAGEKAGDDEATVKIETALVVVPVSVLDRDGKYIPDLKSGNFEVYEDGIKQEISDFGATDSPFHVVLLLDMSGSTRFRAEDIQDAALAFVEQLRPQDQVCVVAFDQTVRVAAEFTNDRNLLTRAILRTRSGGSTRVYDSIDLVLTERLDRIEGRKAIVLFSDGVDTASRLSTREDVLARVEESGTLVYPIRYDTLPQMERGALFITQPGRGPDPRSGQPSGAEVGTRPLPSPGLAAGPRPRPPQQPRQMPPPPGYRPTPEQMRRDYTEAAQYLGSLARQSGGRYYDVETVSDLKEAFVGIADELRRQYWVGYYPSNQARDGSYRKIQVRVDKPEAAVRAREGYRAQDGQRKE